MNNSPLYYRVGPLLYCPANNESIVNSLTNEKFGSKFSLAMCLEDTIRDDCVEEAENKLINSLHKLQEALATKTFFMPKLFVRVRNAEQMHRLIKGAGYAAALIYGFIAPKFSINNADNYIHVLTMLNESGRHPVWFMPIFEDFSLIHLQKRYDILYTLKEKLDTISELVLNIRVGGNDLCNVFGFRRSNIESIHNIRPVANIFSDIMTVYGTDYVISGPVWEYYNGEGWENGLVNELREDRLNGFVGKTVIHPKQIPFVNQAYMVSEKDYEDARAVLNWNTDSHFLVSGSIEKERMNEYKTHRKWAEKIMFLAEAYGISNLCEDNL
ncbi:HpcH/HpaI aldolase/citrate lyase family protein [Lachnospiraceae bacterium 48-33]